MTRQQKRQSEREFAKLKHQADKMVMMGLLAPAKKKKPLKIKIGDFFRRILSTKGKK